VASHWGGLAFSGDWLGALPIFTMARPPRWRRARQLTLRPLPSGSIRLSIFPIKWEGPNTGAELHNIKEGQQSADLFAIPQGYGALKPQKTQLRVTGRTK
jgi:hypothetical protein